jgi:uncharacterized protein (DUF1330 family)
MRIDRKALVVAMFVLTAAFATARAMQTPAAAKKAYLLVQVAVTNTQQYGEYTKLSPAIIEKFGGRFLARGGRSTTLEGTAAPSRVVVIEFPSYERAQAFYNSPEYVAARKVRAGAATAQFVLVEGL